MRPSDRSEPRGFQGVRGGSPYPLRSGATDCSQSVFAEAAHGLTSKPWHPAGLLRAAAALAAVAVLAGPLSADFDPEAWRFARSILVPEGAAAGPACLGLDEHVWDHAAGHDLRDLRIIRGEADETGYAVYVPEKPAPRIEKRPARVLNVAKEGEAASQLVLDLGTEPTVANRIEIETPADDFRCPVTIEGSDDAKSWKTLRDDGSIFAFAGDVRQRFTQVTFPDATFRYLRVVVGAPPGGEPIGLDGATVWLENVLPAPALPLEVERPVVEQNMKEGANETGYVLDLGARHLPVGRIAFETADSGFWRPVYVKASDDGKAWHSVGSGVIFRYRTARFEREQMTVALPETFGRYLSVRVHNGDDPPLAVSGIAVHGRPRYLFFPFEPGRRYRLFYGNAGARAGRYEYAQVAAHIDRRAAVEARLGPVEANTRFIATREAPPPHPWLVRNQWVLYAALAVVVAVLVLIAVRALRRPPEGDAPVT